VRGMVVIPAYNEIKNLERSVGLPLRIAQPDLFSNTYLFQSETTYRLPCGAPLDRVSPVAE